MSFHENINSNGLTLERYTDTASKDTRMFIPIVLNNAEGHSPLDFKCHIATHSLYIVHDSHTFYSECVCLVYEEYEIYIREMIIRGI